MHLENVSPFCLSFLDYKAFEEAAEHFQPYIKFFATFDKGVSAYEPQLEHFHTHDVFEFELSATLSFLLATLTTLHPFILFPKC